MPDNNIQTAHADTPTSPLASGKKQFGAEAASHDDSPTAPCEECHIPLELDVAPKANKPHLCGSCKRRLDREKWDEPRSAIHEKEFWIG